MGLGKAPRSWGVFENFCVKSNLTLCKLQKKWGAGCITCSPNNFVGVTAAPPASGSRPYGNSKMFKLLWSRWSSECFKLSTSFWPLTSNLLNSITDVCVSDMLFAQILATVNLYVCQCSRIRILRFFQISKIHDFLKSRKKSPKSTKFAECL